MKKNYMQILNGLITVLLLVLFTNGLDAQRTVEVEQGVGTLNEAIMSDTTDDGDRVDTSTVYVLAPGGIYLATGTIEFRFPLTIVAGDGEGAKPKVYPAVDEGGESSRLFVPRSDLTLKGLDISNTDEEGGRNKNTIRIKGDAAVITIEDCIINEDTQSPFRCDGDSLKIFIRNTVISNMDQDYNNGRGLDDRGNMIDSLVIENCTYYNIGSRVLRDGGSYIRFFKFDHNTVVNIGRRVLDIGEVVEAHVTNNLFIDCGIIGQESTSTRAIVGVDSITSQILIDEGATQSVTISNNNIHIDQGYLDALPDVDSIVAVPFYNGTAQAFIDEAGTAGTNLNEDVTFTNGPQLNTDMPADWWANPNTSEVFPAFDKTGEPFDFGWMHAVLYNASATSGPIGDLNWETSWPTGIQNQAADNQHNLSGYPNPFSETTTISYEVSMKTDVDLAIYNIVGARIATLVSQQQPAGIYEVNWNAVDLAEGMYLVKLKTGNLVSTTKILLKK